jgi:Ser/Thr protein kinase RdoA (MazF antagonist)
MSNFEKSVAKTWLPDTPTFLNLHPPTPKWTQIKSDNQRHLELWKTLESLFSESFQLFRLETSQTGLKGYYRLKSGSNDFFLRVMSQDRFDRFQEEEQVLSFLRKRNIPLLHTIAPHDISIKPDLYVAFQPFLEAHFFNPNVDSLGDVGNCLSQIHKTLKTFPHDNIKARGQLRHEQLIQILRNRQGLAEVAPPELMSLLSSSQESDLLPLIESPQAIHGDLNLANILFSQKGCTFIDFEDTLCSWLNPMLDVAMVLERFILTMDYPDRKKHALDFISNYGHQSFDPEKICRILKAMSLRALLLLINKSLRDRSPLSAEARKFVFLNEQIKKNRSFLQSVQDRLK